MALVAAPRGLSGISILELPSPEGEGCIHLCTGVFTRSYHVNADWEYSLMFFCYVTTDVLDEI